MKIKSLVILFSSLAVVAATGDESRLAVEQIPETPAQYTQRMKWFNEARFGMFIHWGLYSQAAGEFNGKRVDGVGEWIMEFGHIPVSQYERLAPQFDPEKFNAREWVRMAKGAGMEYIVITSKHHDGFGLWPSKLNDWNIGRTPFKRDPLKELSEACRAAGIKFCVYYSIMDWRSSDWGTRRAWNDMATGTPDMDRYVAYMKGQLKELITQYHPAIIWFDGEWESPWTHERGVDLYNYLRALDPKLIINNRVGKGRAGMGGMNKGEGVGDYGTPEQEIPPTGFGKGVYWESCMTMNNTWGYRRDDQNWKTAQTLVRNLIDCASKGGNYLLNVGPTGEGLFPQASVERLAAVGDWMKVNGESIYGTSASPFAKLTWGRCTQKTDGKQTTLFLHVLDWPADGRLLLPGLMNKPTSARLLASRKELFAEKTDDGVVIELPKEAPDSISSTVVLRIAGSAEVVESRIRPDKDGCLVLGAGDAELHGNLFRVESMDGKKNIGYWSQAGDWAQWKITITQAGKYDLIAELSGEAVGGFNIEVGDQKLGASSSDTKSYRQYEIKSLGGVTLAPGNYGLAIRPVVDRWQPMNLRSLKLKQHE